MEGVERSMERGRWREGKCFSSTFGAGRERGGGEVRVPFLQIGTRAIIAEGAVDGIDAVPCHPPPCPPQVKVPPPM